MPLTNFNDGVSSFGMPVLPGSNGAIIPPTTGKTLFVSSNGGTGGNFGDGSSPETPFSTIAGALANCRAGKGDLIVCMPGHAESLTGAGALTLSVSGVSVIGLGNGANRPTLTLTSTATTILISAANVLLRNFIIKTSVDELVTCISVTAANAWIDRVDFVETTSAQARQFLLTNASATDLTISNCYHQQATAPGAAAHWISLVGADRARIINNTFLLTGFNGATTAVIGSSATAPVNILIYGNTMVLLGGTTIVSAILLVANTSGMVAYNNIAGAVTAVAGLNAIASCYGIENYATETVNTNGILDPVAT